MPLLSQLTELQFTTHRCLERGLHRIVCSDIDPAGMRGIAPVVEALDVSIIDLPDKHMLEATAVIALIPAQHTRCSAPAKLDDFYVTCMPFTRCLDGSFVLNAAGQLG